MAEIKSGVLLKLKDEFSKGMGKAAGASGDFAQKTLGALDKVNSALSGTAAKIGAFGVTLSLGAAAREIIQFDDRLTRIGLTADASAEQVGKLKQKIFDAAQAGGIKVDTGSIADALDVVMTKTGDLKYSEANIRNIAVAIKATGESGGAIGSVFAEFQKFGYTAEQIGALMDDMVKQGDQGAFTFGEFAKAGSAVISAYAQIGTAPENIKKANAAMQIIMMGTKSADIAVTALEATMAELSDPKKQKDLAAYGVAVRDGEGAFRDLNDIMADVIEVSKQQGNTDFLGEIFGESSMRAIRAYGNFYEKMYPGLIELGDTQGAMQGKAAKMAGTLKSNLDNLQTAFVRFADGNLTAPLAKLADFLNKLSEDPKRVEAVFNSIKRGLLVIGGIKIGAGVMSFLSTLKNFKGGNANITEQINLAGSAGSAMPVFVTNWGSGGAAGGSAPLGRPPGAGGLLDQYGNPIGANPKPQPVPPGQPPNGKGKWNLNKPNWKGAAKAGAGAAAVTALMTVPGMIGELSEISKNGEMTKEEKSIARGGAIGETVGSIGGAAAGALAGAAIGSVVPVVGTAIGALVGGLIGQFGGPVGRFIGEKVGAAVGKEVEDKVPEPTNLPPAITDYAPYAPAPQNIKMDGQVGFDVNVSVQDDRIKTDAYFTGGDIPEWLNPGNARAARGYN